MPSQEVATGLPCSPLPSIYPNRLQQGADLLRSQIPHENVTWMRNLRNELSSAWENKLVTLLQDIHGFERSGSSTTWVQNAKEQRLSKHTMGYQLQSTRSIDADQ
jgi:hypothetical protein